MKRIPRLLTLLALLPGALFLAGCDERNEADLPPQIYRLAATYSGPSIVSDVDVSGNTVVVALEYVGYNVIDVSNLNAIAVLDTYRLRTAGARCRAVAVDDANSLVAAVLPADGADPNPVRDFRRHRRISGFGASGAAQCVFISKPDTAVLWLTDNVGDNRMKAERWRKSDTTWTWETTGLGWDAPSPDSRVQYFEGNAEGIIAVAWEAGVTLYDCNLGAVRSRTILPGRTRDCAWHDDYLLAASELMMVVMSVANLDTPQVVTQFSIPGADRLRQVEVEGNIALLMDEFDGVYVVDISNVLAPQFVQLLPLSEPTEIVARGNRLYVGDRITGLAIYER